MKQHKMVEVNSAYKYGRYEKNWSNSLRVMSNIKLLAKTAELTNTTHYIDPSIIWIKTEQFI